MKLRERLPDRRTCQLLAVCVAVGFGLDFLYFTGFFASDDVGYLQTARALANLGTDTGFKWGTIASTRLGVNLPDALVYWLSDGSVGLIAWFHALYHLALVILAYAIGRELRDAGTGLIAAALVAVNPVLYVYAGAVLPDNATAVWLAVLLLLLLRAQRRALEAPLSVRESCRRYLTAGLVLGIAYGCKETALIMTVPCAAAIIAAAPRLRSTVWLRDGAFLAAGLVAYVVLEALVLRYVSGEWLSRIGAVDDSGDIMAKRMSTQGSGLLDRFAYLWSSRMFLLMPATTVLLLGGALAAPVLRPRNLAVMAFFWWPLVYLTVGSTSFTDYRPSTIQDRYYAIVIVPAAVMAAIVLARLLERWGEWARRPRWAGREVTAGALVVAIALIGVYEARRNLGLGGNLYKATEARAFIAAYERARTAYPDHQILLSDWYQRRMTPLLYPRAPKNVFAHKHLTPKGDGPTLPFIYLVRERDALPEGVSYPHELGQGTVEIKTLEIIHAPRRRLDVITHAFRGAFGAAPRRRIPRTHSGGAVIQLISEPSAEALAAAAEAAAAAAAAAVPAPAP